MLSILSNVLLPILGQSTDPSLPDSGGGKKLIIELPEGANITVNGEAASTVSNGAGAPAGTANATPDALDKVWESVVKLGDQLLSMLPQVLIAIVVIILTSIIARIVNAWVKKLFGKTKLRDSLRDLFAQLIYIAIWFCGILIATGVVFPGFGMGELVATAGLASIAIGFAFQDIFENFFAGILILWRFPFETGDFITVEGVDGIEGTVEDIWIRMTLIRTVEGVLVLVPNSTIYKNPVHVLTSKDVRRITVACGIAYGEDVGEGRAVIRKAVESCQTVNTDHPVEIFAQAFGSSSIDYEVTWWTGSTPLEQRKSRDEVVEAVKKGLDDAGIEIPYPYRTLTFSKNEPDIINAVAGRRGMQDDESGSASDGE